MFQHKVTCSPGSMYLKESAVSWCILWMLPSMLGSIWRVVSVWSAPLSDKVCVSISRNGMATCYLSRLIPPLFPFHENVIALIRVTCWSKVISAWNCRLLSEVLQAHVDAIVSWCSLLMIVFHLHCCIGPDLYICHLGNCMLFVILLDVFLFEFPDWSHHSEVSLCICST